MIDKFCPEFLFKRVTDNVTKIYSYLERWDFSVT